jgi:hypothetical protein
MSGMQTINMTMSFRAAWRFGVPHLAGQGVTLYQGDIGQYVDRHYDVMHRGEIIARVYYPRSVRERGGVQRAAETRLPGRARQRRR